MSQMGLGNTDLVNRIKKEIKQVYLADHRPWVIGFSGGKDSTAVVQLVFEALSELKREDLRKKIFVISSDTLIETPLIITSLNANLLRIQEKALDQGLPIETHKVRPSFDKSFWSLLIGRGYPSPRQKFRWCTDRLKIEPANKFILDKISNFGEVIMVLGVRSLESSTRAQVIETHSVEGKILMRHSTLSNAFVYAPIREFSLDDVWSYLLQSTSPWGSDNHALLALYKNSNSECPLIVDKEIKESAGSCGNSRFGCWACTVVKEDKALVGFIDNGEEWLIPLLEFRSWLTNIRDQREFRQKYRMNGTVYLTSVNPETLDLTHYEKVHEHELGDYLKNNDIDLSQGGELNLLVVDENGNTKRLGLGPFTLEAREIILRKLLETQRATKNPYDPEFQLISPEELKVIRASWQRDGDWQDRVPVIYHEVTGEDLDWESNDRPLFEEDQMTDLELLCQDHKVNLSIMKKLIALEKENVGYKVRRGILQGMEKVLKQEWIHL